MRLRPMTVLLASLLAVTAACGGDDGGTSGTTTTEGPVETTDAGDGGTDTTDTTAVESEFADFCTDQQALLEDAGTRLFFTTPDGPPAFDEYRDRQAALLEDAPPELADALQALSTYDFETNGLSGFQRDLGADAMAVSTWLQASCDAEAAAPEPAFVIDHTEGTGLQSVYFVRGTCPDGSFPTAVSGPSGLFASGPATDLGDGLYSFALPLKEGTDPMDELVLEEAQIPDNGVNGTCP